MRVWAGDSGCTAMRGARRPRSIGRHRITPPTLFRWHHEAERVDGKPGSVVYAKDASAEVAIVPDGAGSLVTYRLMAEPGSVLNTFMLRILAPRPIGRSFETSLSSNT